MPPTGVRLCLLQPEATSPQRGADLFSRVADIARAAGHHVTEAIAGESGITIRTPTGNAKVTLTLPPRLVGPAAAQIAYRVHEWLRREAFDVVCAPAAAGLPFYALSARLQGLELRDTAFCLVADRLTLFSRHLSGEMPRGLDDVVQDEMERRSLALADVSLFPDQAVADWARQRDWSVPGLRSTQAARDAAAAANAVWSACLDAAQQRHAAPNLAEDLPLVSACIPHFNRPALLRQAIESLRRQTYPKLEIVVVDDASTAPEARSALDDIAADLARHGGRLVRHDSNRYLGAARNTAAAHASGEFVFFLDDDDYARPEQVATLVQVARATGADIVNSFCDRLTDTQAPQPDREVEERWLTLGNAPAAGLFQNLFGTASALFRTSSFRQLGGFTELRGVGCEDWEMFARAALAGMNLQTVPLALYWYRLTPGSMIQTGSAYAGANRVLATYAAQMPPSLWPVLRFVHAADSRLRLKQDSLRQCESALRHREAVIAHRDAELADMLRLNNDNAERIAAMSRELHELRAIRNVLLEGYGATPQAAVDAIVQSASWRAAGAMQGVLRWMTRRRPEAPPRVTDWAQAAAVIATLQRSSSWELTGPLRALARLAGRG